MDLRMKNIDVIIYLFRLQHNGSWIHIQPHLLRGKQQEIKQSENK